MKRIEVPADIMRKVLDCDQGRWVLLPVKVPWPELQLTEQQVLENAIDHAHGRSGRHPDPSYIELHFPHLADEAPVTEADYVSAAVADLNALWPNEAPVEMQQRVATGARATYELMQHLGFKVTRA